MHALTESQLRASFVNCTKGEASRLRLPRDLDARPWDDLDLLGWVDPQSPGRAHLVAERDGRAVGVLLRAPAAGAGRVRNLCSLCLTSPAAGVALLVAPRAGKAGRDGHSVGTYICADLNCSLYVRDKLSPGTPVMHETLSIEQRVARLRGNLGDFLRRVLAPV